MVPRRARNRVSPPSCLSRKSHLPEKTWSLSGVILEIEVGARSLKRRVRPGNVPRPYRSVVASGSQRCRRACEMRACDDPLEPTADRALGMGAHEMRGEAVQARWSHGFPLIAPLLPAIHLSEPLSPRINLPTRPAVGPAHEIYARLAPASARSPRRDARLGITLATVPHLAANLTLRLAHRAPDGQESDL